MKIKLAVTLICALLTSQAQTQTDNNTSSNTPSVFPIPVVIGVCVLVVGTVVCVEIVDFAKRKLNPQGCDYWPQAILGIGGDPSLTGMWRLQKQRGLPAGGGWYKCDSGAACWLMAFSGNEQDVHSQFLWVITDAPFDKATSVYAWSGTPGTGQPADWNQPEQHPANQAWNAGSLLPTWPNITNTISLKLPSFTLPPSMQALPKPQIHSGYPVMTLATPDVIGTNIIGVFPDDWTNCIGKYGVREINTQWVWNGGKWGFNHGEANYGSNPGGLPYITNWAFFNYSDNSLKLDLATPPPGIISVMFFVTNYPIDESAGEGGAMVPLTITGSQNASKYTIQKSGNLINWSNTMTLNVIGDGTVTFMDNFAGQKQSYRMTAQ